MSRTRMLKPDFFRSRSLARVSIPARLTFQGLWVEADAAGRGLAHPVILKGSIWPLDDDITPRVIDAHLAELATEHITLYTVGEDTYYVIRNWEKHQSAAYRTGESKYPDPPVVQPAQPVVQVAREVVLEPQEVVHKGKGIEEKRAGALIHSLPERAAAALECHVANRVAQRDPDDPEAFAATIRSQDGMKYGPQLCAVLERNPDITPELLAYRVIGTPLPPVPVVPVPAHDPSCACEGSGWVNRAEEGHPAVYDRCTVDQALLPVAEVIQLRKAGSE